MKPVETPPIAGFPEELKCYPQWMGTRFARRKDGKVDKPPYRVREGQPIIKADKTDPENWSTFAEATEACDRGQVDAIGFVFTEDDPFFVEDLDDVVDIETGEIQQAAAEIIHAMNSYTELSCSGQGVHIIGQGRKPAFAGCTSTELGFKVELYEKKRFVVLTGRALRSTAPQDRQGELDELCRRLWLKRSPGRAQRPPNTGPVDLEDAVLLERARTSRSGPKFHKLYDLGDTSGYASHSNADFSLLNMLCFWTAGDRERMITLFEASALYRNQADGKHRGYAALSVDNALKSYRGPFYRPRLTREVREEAKREEAPDPLAPYLNLMLNPSAWTGRRGASAYKAFTAAVIMATEDGVLDDDGDLRIGTDIRRLAEVAGTSFQTLSSSALPYLMQDMNILKWKRGKGKKAGVLVLKNSACTTLNTRVSTQYSVQSCAAPKHALETLRLLIRMRFGYSKSDMLLKLGMPAMFVAVALVASRANTRGETAEDLSSRTGRRKSTLLGRDGAIKRLKAAGIVQETREGRFRLTREFAAKYKYVLEHSGITYAEREQKRRHAEDRKARDAKLTTHKQPTRLRGRPQMERLLRKQREEARRREKAQETKKRTSTPAPGEVRQLIDRLIREGMSPRWARMEVLGNGGVGP